MHNVPSNGAGSGCSLSAFIFLWQWALVSLIDLRCSLQSELQFVMLSHLLQGRLRNSSHSTEQLQAVGHGYDMAVLSLACSTGRN